ncbi:TniQ family protein [Cytobacillus praedii]|uniref:TniQ family protein n=1 Tax=Cytobacillus praedii TaxID=1742358 RepID=UPI003AF702A2
MKKEKLKIYEFAKSDSFETQPLYLYDIEPVYVSGKDSESLSSYLIRLSNYHNVEFGKLATEVLIPEINKYYKPYADGVYKNPLQINGFGDLTKRTLDILEILTGRVDLKKLTLINYENVLGKNKLFKEQKAWCSLCFNEMREDNIHIYEKLIWNLDQYNYCIKHSTSLENKCTNCGKRQKVLPRRGMNGFCQFCYKWLGNNQSYGTIGNQYEEDSIYKAKQIEELLDFYFDSNAIKKEILFSSFKHINGKLVEEIYKYHFIETITITHTSFQRYYNGEVSPTLETLLELCSRLNLTLINIMENDCINLGLKNEERQFPHFYRGDYRKNFDQLRAKRYLEKVLVTSRKIPLEEICFNLKVAPQTLHKKFPQLVKNIKEKNKAIRNVTPIKRYYHKRDSNMVEKYLQEVIDSPEIINYSKVAMELGIGAVTLRRRFPEMIKEIQNKNKALIAKQKKGQYIKAYLEQYLQHDNYESVREISMVLNSEVSILSNMFESLWEKVINKNKNISGKFSLPTETENSFEVNRMYSIIINYLRTTLDRPVYITEIERNLGITRFKIHKYFPEIISYIKERNIEVIKNNKEKVKQRRRELMEAAIIKLSSQGIYPSVRKVKKEMGYEFGYRTELVNLWREKLIELGIEIAKGFK